jgi:hypothetical protein
VNAAQRRAAVEQHELAIAAINAMFDKADELVAARDRLLGLAPLGPGDDVIRDVETILATASLLSDALTQLRTAALAAAEHRNRSDLAADLGTKPTVLFPRAARPAGDTVLTLEARPTDVGRLDEEEG